MGSPMSHEERRLALEERREEREDQRLAFEEQRELRIGGLEERRMALDEQRLAMEQERLKLDHVREVRLEKSKNLSEGREERLGGGAVESKPKRDSKITEAQRTWSRCWFGSGAEMLPNSQDPYIGRSALSEMLRSDGVSEPKIKAALDPSKPSLIGSLIDSELIRFSGHGWVAVGFFADELRKVK